MRPCVALETPQWRGGISGGVWQNVRLIASGAAFIKDVFIVPNLRDNTATFNLEIDHTAIKGAEIGIKINLLDAEHRRITVKEKIKVHPGLNDHKIVVNIPDTQYWSPVTPNLYCAKITIENDGLFSDNWSGRFGMRELTI